MKKLLTLTTGLLLGSAVACQCPFCGPSEPVFKAVRISLITNSMSCRHARGGLNVFRSAVLS